MSSVALETNEIRTIAERVLGRETVERRIAIVPYAKLPEPVRSAAERQAGEQAESTTQAVYWNRTCYLVEGAFASDRDVERAIFHEYFGHFGLRVRFQRDLESVLDDLFERAGGREGVLALAEAQGIPLREVARDLDSDTRMTDRQRRWALMDELLARMAETSGSLRLMLQAFIGAAREWLRRRGWLAMSGVGESDLARIVVDARRAALAADSAKAAGVVPTLAPAFQRRWQGDAPLFSPSEQAPVFYSALLEVVTAGKGAPKKGDAAQWKGWLDGAQRRGEIKKSERDWLGVDAWLEGRDSTTRAELADFIRANQVQVEEVQLGELSDAEADSIGQDMGFSPVEVLDDDGDFSHYVVQDEYGNTIKRGNDDYRDREFDTEADAQEGIREFVRENHAQNGDTSAAAKFAQWTLDGGENYRELLLTLPPKGVPSELAADVHAAGKRARDAMARLDEVRDTDGEAAARQEVARANATYEALKQKAIAADQRYKSSHFDQPNILAHVRYNERTDADGKRVLFIEEIQSDWHQAGRKQGYGDIASVQDTLRETGTMPDEWARMSPEQQEQLRRQVAGFGFKAGVPDAPFKATDEWAMLAFKRMVRHAAENGFDRIAWTTGEQQAERYDLSRKIGRITYIKWDASDVKNMDVQRWDVTAHSLTDDRTVWSTEGAELSEIESNLGKDIAERIANDQGDADPKYKARKQLNGDGLKMGGDGMRGFYDNILPKAVSKWAKPFGAKVSTTTIHTDPLRTDDTDETPLTDDGEVARTVHALSVTDAMRESVLHGIPMFRMAPADDEDVNQNEAQSVGFGPGV